MDDFGTGYSSLSNLLQLPVTEIKLDKEFVDGITAENYTTSIASIVANTKTNKGFEYILIAEGIETEEQSRLLQELGYDIHQGYYYSKPVTDAVFVKFCEEWNEKHTS